MNPIADKLKHAGLNLGVLDPDADSNAESPLFGFWVFLMSDAVIFAVLFIIYASMMHSTAGGPAAHDVFELKSAFIETMILLASSFTFGMVSLSLKYHPDNRRRLFGWMLVTLILGLAFLGFELHDFASMAGKGAVPQRSGFLSAFFALVPTHGIHVASGCLWMIVMMVQVAVLGTRPDRSEEHTS